MGLCTIGECMRAYEAAYRRQLADMFEGIEAVLQGLELMGKADMGSNGRV
jgi:hypothetical protein